MNEGGRESCGPLYEEPSWQVQKAWTGACFVYSRNSKQISGFGSKSEEEGTRRWNSEKCQGNTPDRNLKTSDFTLTLMGKTRGLLWAAQWSNPSYAGWEVFQFQVSVSAGDPSTYRGEGISQSRSNWWRGIKTRVSRQAGVLKEGRRGHLAQRHWWTHGGLRTDLIYMPLQATANLDKSSLGRRWTKTMAGLNLQEEETK